jgi:hypothetical protein
VVRAGGEEGVIIDSERRGQETRARPEVADLQRWPEMSVNRITRDALADALKSFLRGEITGSALQTKLEAIDAALIGKPIADKSLVFIFMDVSDLIIFPDYGFNRPISDKQWQKLSRDLVFLKSDREISFETIPKYVSEEEYHGPEELAIRWNFLILAVVIGFSFVVGLWFYFLASILSFIFFLQWSRRHEAALDKKREEYFRLFNVFPFSSEKDWLAHQHLVEEWRLRILKPNFPSEPAIKGTWAKILSALSSGMTCIGMSVGWPISLTLLWITSEWSRYLRHRGARNVSVNNGVVG